MSQIEAVQDPLETRIRLITLGVVGMLPMELGLLYVLQDGVPVPWLAVAVASTALTIAILWAYRQRELKRRAALGEQGARLGMQFQPAATGALLEGFELYRGGVRSNVLFGARAGFDVELFGYAFSSGSGGSSSSVTQTVALLRKADWQLPAFRLRARAFLDGVFNDGGVSFADTPEFTSEYHLSAAADECAVGRLFSRTLRAWLGGRGGLWVEGRGNQLLVCRIGKRVPAQDMRAFLDDALQVAERFQRG